MTHASHVNRRRPRALNRLWNGTKPIVDIVGEISGLWHLLHAAASFLNIIDHYVLLRGLLILQFRLLHDSEQLSRCFLLRRFVMNHVYLLKVWLVRALVLWIKHQHLLTFLFNRTRFLQIVVISTVAIGRGWPTEALIARG